MSNLWERFENIVTPDEVENAKPQFTPLEAGDYDCVLEEIAPAESQQGLPMIKGKFRTIEGNRVIFYNQMLQNLSNPQMTAVNVAEGVKFIGDIIGDDIDFTGLVAFATVISGIETGGTYKINVSYGKKDTEMKFPKLRVIKPKVEINPEDDADLPF